MLDLYQYKNFSDWWVKHEFSSSPFYLGNEHFRFLKSVSDSWFKTPHLDTFKKYFFRWDCFKRYSGRGTFARKVHAWPKQTASEIGEFVVGEGIVTGNDDIHMQGELPVWLASSTRIQLFSFVTGSSGFCRCRRDRQIATPMGELA